MNKSQRLKALLAKGYFPSELPPPFNTEDFGKYRKFVEDNWPTQLPPKTSPELYNIQRLGWKRRSLSIVNPVSQFYLCKAISEGWKEIDSVLQSSKASLDRAGLQLDADRAVLKPDFSRIEFMKLKAGGDYDHILVSDISRFYGTIYTHVLPWAFKGKTWCKQHLNSPALRATLGDKLDCAVRRGQDNQTIGIPVGPDTSRILSELIAVAVEKRFLELSTQDPVSVFRFVDDWFIGHDNAQQAEAAIRHLAEACADFELELNLEKTKILTARDEIIASWPSELLELMVNSSGQKAQTKQLNRFFSKAFSFAKIYPNDNVIDYALKLARSFSIQKESYPLFESFILRCARAYPISLPTVVQILVNYRKDGAPINLGRCKKLIEDELQKSVPLRHTTEVSWVLFLAKALGIKLSADVLHPVCKVEHSVWALLVLDIEAHDLIEGQLDKSFWNSLMVTESLVGSNWLLAYEADLKGWLTPQDPNFVSNHPWFGVLKRKKISFYSTVKNVDTFKKSRKRSASFAQLKRNSMQSWLTSLSASYGD